MPGVFVLPLLAMVHGGCNHGGPTSVRDNFIGIDATFQNNFPSSISPGETVTLHVACHVNSLPAGPFHAYLEVFADKNLEFQGVASTSSQQPMVILNGTEHEAFDNLGIGFYVGPLTRGEVPYVDLVYRVKAPPIDYNEPSGYLSAHVGTVIFPDPNLQEGYNHGPSIEVFIPIAEGGS